MKETRIFFAPEAAQGNCELPPEEAGHAIRVLRMREGDTMTLVDGMGRFYEARITLASPKHCRFETLRSWDDQKLWAGSIRLAVAPTKNMDRMEWFTEKATEIGVDEIILLDCDNSERHIVKTERLEKIAISAMKQSHKAFKPTITPMMPFGELVRQPFPGQRFIAHCHEASASGELHLSGQNFLGDLLSADTPSLVLIGPEGDFSISEVEEALKSGFQPISLGESRLRTETAALVAVHLMYLSKRRKA